MNEARDERYAMLCQALVSATQDFAYLFDLEGRFRYVNPPLLALWGLPLEHAIGKSFFELPYPRELAEKLQRQIQQVIEQRQVVRDETEYESPQGILGYYEYIFTPVFAADGSVSAVAGTTRDISRRKQTELDLIDARKRLDLAMRAGEMGTWVLDIAENRGFGDTNLARLSAMPQEAMRGGGVHQYLASIHPSDRRRVVSAIREAISAGVTYEAEYRVRGADRERWVVARGVVERGPDGQALRLTGVVLDITSRKLVEGALRASEERYRSLFASIDQSFCVVEVLFDDSDRAVDFRFLETNPAFERQSGLRDPTGKTIRELVPELEEHWFLIYGKVALTGERVEFEDSSPRLARWFAVEAFRVGGADSRKVAILSKDITASRLADSALRDLALERGSLLDAERAARSEAERTGRIKDEFLATLSHELRTPLNAILGWSQIVKQRASDPQEVARGLTVIERNARAQAQIIEDLLDMSRIISGKIRLDVQPVDLGSIVQSALETARPAADAKSVELVASVPALTDVHITGDSNRLHQVLWNLLSNAVKFTPKGGRVEVKLRRVAEHLEIDVCDSGEGIAAEFLGFVFDRFRQADASTTRRHGGLGLGLAIVKQLVELHGGSVQVRSEGKGLGTTFGVTLPLLATEQEPELELEQARHSLPPGALTLQTGTELTGLRLLVVDDEPDARALVQRLLEDNGASVHAVGSVSQALALLASARFDLIFSDIGMPQEDGYALIRKLRALPRDQGGSTPAVALTAYARTEDKAEALRAGFQLHMVKPIEPSELIAAASRLTGRSRPSASEPD